MSNPISCVLFDYGDVISLPQTLEARQKQAELVGLDLVNFQRLWHQYRMSYDQGVIDGKEYWSRILAHSRAPQEDRLIDELIQADIESWWPTVDWIHDWAGRLRDSGIRTGVLSNMPPELVTEKLMELQDRYPGLQEVNVGASVMSTEQSVILEQLELFGKEVMPTFKKQARKQAD